MSNFLSSTSPIPAGSLHGDDDTDLSTKIVQTLRKEAHKKLPPSDLNIHRIGNVEVRRLEENVSIGRSETIHRVFLCESPYKAGWVLDASTSKCMRLLYHITTISQYHTNIIINSHKVSKKIRPFDFKAPLQRLR